MPSRRSLLHSVGAGLAVGFAGCAGGGADDDTDTATTTTSTPVTAESWGYIRPDSEPTTVPEPLDCDESDLRRLDWEVSAWGGNDLALRVERTEYALGETVTIRLFNTTKETQYTGTVDEYLLEIRTEAGWQAVYGYTVDRPIPFTAEPVPQQPGLSHTWEMPLTADGVTRDFAHDGDVTVCPSLQPGRYRFQFVGMAVAFDVTA
jgi:hypothetical protein